MIFHKKYFFVLLSIASLSSFAQTSYPTRTDKHIFWQPDTKLTFNDFKGDTLGGKYKDSYKKAGMQAMSYLGIWSILDVPKKKDRGKLLEKAYIVPAFDMSSSYILTADTNELAIQQIFFDMTEVFARTARQRLSSLQDSVKAYGILWTMYSTVIADIKADQSRFFIAYTRDVIINKRAGALASWRQSTNELLNSTKIWATKPLDCYRFITDKPIEKDYEQSVDLAAPMPPKTK